jgi:hypothetical protein
LFEDLDVSGIGKNALDFSYRPRATPVFAGKNEGNAAASFNRFLGPAAANVKQPALQASSQSKFFAYLALNVLEPYKFLIDDVAGAVAEGGAQLWAAAKGERRNAADKQQLASRFSLGASLMRTAWNTISNGYSYENYLNPRGSDATLSRLALGTAVVLPFAAMGAAKAAPLFMRELRTAAKGVQYGMRKFGTLFDPNAFGMQFASANGAPLGRFAWAIERKTMAPANLLFRKAAKEPTALTESQVAGREAYQNYQQAVREIRKMKAKDLATSKGLSALERRIKIIRGYKISKKDAYPLDDAATKAAATELRAFIRSGKTEGLRQEINSFVRVSQTRVIQTYPRGYDHLLEANPELRELLINIDIGLATKKVGVSWAAKELKSMRKHLKELDDRIGSLASSAHPRELEFANKLRGYANQVRGRIGDVTAVEISPFRGRPMDHVSTGRRAPSGSNREHF